MPMSIPAFTTPEALGAPALAPEITANVRPSAAWRRLVTHRSAVVGLAVMSIYAVAAIVGPIVFPFNPSQNHLVDVFLAPGQQGHLLGTDNLGRDELLMLVYGSRYTLSLGLMAGAPGPGGGAPPGALPRN